MSTSSPCVSIDEDVLDFFGASSIRSLKGNACWTADDAISGQSIFHHYRCHTIPRSHQDESDQPRSGAGIPPFIHFIWLGDKPVPLVNDNGESECICSWRRHHPQWMIQVWTDDDLLQEHHMKKWFNAEALQFAIQNKNYGMASDILRLELLFEHGGLYVDIDYLCVDSVSDLHRQFDFYCGASNTGVIELNNGLLASQPRNYLIQQMMERIRDFSMQVFRQQSHVTLHHISAFLDDKSRESFDIGMALTPEQVIRHTGPGLLTFTVVQVLTSAAISASCDLSRLAVLPYQVFHPLPNTLRRIGLEALDEELLEGHIAPRVTKAVHLWQCSWQDKSRS